MIGRPSENAEQWIRFMLNMGDMPAETLHEIVWSKTYTLGFSWRTLQKIKMRCGIRHYRGKHGISYWTIRAGVPVQRSEWRRCLKP